ncbi:hypothetical protein LDENG_00232880, partial [Lucifuga dentata]
LLSGLPNYAIRSLQLVQNAAARLLTKTRKYDHITPVLASLHWLPVQARDAALLVIPSINKKIAWLQSIAYHAPYLWNTLPLHVKEASSAENFKSRLKTHLYSLHYSLP